MSAASFVPEFAFVWAWRRLSTACGFADRTESLAEVFFLQMEFASDSAEHLLFAQKCLRRGTATCGADLRERREQLLGGLRGTMSIGESVQSVGHCFEFVFQGVDRLCE